MTITARPVSVGSFERLAATLCAADRVEFKASGGRDVAAVLQQCVPLCPWIDEIVSGGELLAVYGVTRAGPGVGLPWMLTSEAMAGADGHSVFPLLQHAVRRMRNEFDLLQNWAHAENVRALRLLRCLGFEVGAEPAGPGGAFRIFHWRRDV